MEFAKNIKEIKFNDTNVFGTEMPVSEPIVMASAAGWYVGAICKDPDCDGMIVPFDRYTEYMTQESAQKCLDTSIKQGGFA
tara:strand:- start:1904 stop:2146 length:243 start_codon:yes stop_codon:yes gene_type:complete